MMSTLCTKYSQVSPRFMSSLPGSHWVRSLYTLVQRATFLNSCTLKCLFNTLEASRVCSKEAEIRIQSYFQLPGSLVFLYFLFGCFSHSSPCFSCPCLVLQFLNYGLLASGFDLDFFFFLDLSLHTQTGCDQTPAMNMDCDY